MKNTSILYIICRSYEFSFCREVNPKVPWSEKHINLISLQILSIWISSRLDWVGNTMPGLSQIWFHPKFYKNLPSIWSRPSVMQLMQMMLTQTSGRWLIYILSHPLPLAAACSTSQQICTAADLQMFSTPGCFLRWFPHQDVSSADSHPRMFPQLPLAPDVSYQHIMPTDDCRFTFPIAGIIRYLHQKRFSIHTIWQLPPASIQWRWEDENPVGFIRHFSSVFFLRL